MGAKELFCSVPFIHAPTNGVLPFLNTPVNRWANPGPVAACLAQFCSAGWAGFGEACACVPLGAELIVQGGPEKGECGPRGSKGHAVLFPMERHTLEVCRLQQPQRLQSLKERIGPNTSSRHADWSLN